MAGVNAQQNTSSTTINLAVKDVAARFWKGVSIRAEAARPSAPYYVYCFSKQTVCILCFCILCMLATEEGTLGSRPFR
jgi:hypothetical protein